MAETESEVATVVQQKGNRVLLAFPMTGFPRGFKLKSGDRVVLVHEPSGTKVKPLVRSVTVDLPRSAVAKKGKFKIGKKEFILQSATARGQETPAISQKEAGKIVIWTVESKSTKGPKRVIATRPLR